MDIALLGIPLGFVLLYIGANWLVDNAKRIAFILGVSPFVIGLTVVAFGSSAPEAALSVMSSKSADIVLGNVIGSNIANIGLAVGLSAIIFPLSTRFDTVRFEVWVMLLATFFITFFAWTGGFGFLHGLLFIALIVTFIYTVYRKSLGDPLREMVDETVEVKADRSQLGRYLLMTILGLAALIVGANVFVDGAVVLADMLNVSELVIGLIVVALGTSLPELSICLVAAFKKETEIILSNIIGSNIFNALFVLGLGALVAPIAVPSGMLSLDFPVMILLSVMLVLAIRSYGMVSRWEGAVLFAVYLLYVAVLLMPSLLVF
ncbi:MAG: calcium/sodium antiporter [Candidatus Methanomethylophilaceae archaeon]|jgi:cation:H+ antiporter